LAYGLTARRVGAAPVESLGLKLRALDGRTDGHTFYLITCLLIQPLRTVNRHTDWLGKTVGRSYARLEPYLWPLASIAHTITV